MISHEGVSSPTRGLEDLTRRVSAILSLSDDGLRAQFVGLAANETPTQSFELAFDLACEHFGARMARDFAKACRFLAIIRRDYGQEEFNNVTTRG